MKRKLFHFSPHTFLYLMVAFLLLNDLFSLTEPLRTAFAAALGQATPVTVPPYLNYQGTLREAEGKPITGAHKLTFRIYFDVTAPLPDAKWTETHENVTVRDGHFSVLLGNLTPLDPTLFNGADRFVGITLDALDEMVPRQRFASVPYSFNADMLDGLHAQDFALASQLRAPDGDPNPAVFVNNSGSVGIGTTSPERTLDVRGNLRLMTGGGQIGGGQLITSALELRADLFEISIKSPTRGLSISGGGTEKNLYLNPTGGNVGINTTTPGAALGVTGDARINGNTHLNGNVRINGTIRFGTANLPPVFIRRYSNLGPDSTTPITEVSPNDYDCTVGSWSINMNVDELTKGPYTMWTFVDGDIWYVRTRHWTNGNEENKVDVVCFLKSITRYDGVRTDQGFN